MKKLLSLIKCFFGFHEIVHKAWKNEIGIYSSYHSMHYCKHCDKIFSHKSDVL